MQDDSRHPGGPPSARQPKAVALTYDQAAADTPRISATGRGAVAEQILAIAFANGVKVREDADLVEILSLIDVDSPIPLEAFAAVAEILRYVYQAERRLPGVPKAGTARGA
jgi:flagellar biosynthesis protein